MVLWLIELVVGTAVAVLAAVVILAWLLQRHTKQWEQQLASPLAGGNSPVGPNPQLSPSLLRLPSNHDSDDVEDGY